MESNCNEARRPARFELLRTAANLACIALALTAHSAGRFRQDDRLPAWFVDKETHMPYLWQTDPTGGFDRGGSDFCGPTSLTNGLVWLARSGYQNLVSKGADDFYSSALESIRQLARPEYMGVRPGVGIGPGQVMLAARRYIEERGYKIEAMVYQGWRKIPKTLDSAGEVPDPAWLEKQIATPSTVVLLNVGWYTQPQPGVFERNGGHWVTLAGFLGSGSDPSSTAFIVHNPGKHPPFKSVTLHRNLERDTIRFSLIPSGKLEAKNKQFLHSASGQYSVSGEGLPISKSAQGAILEGAVIIRLTPKE